MPFHLYTHGDGHGIGLSTFPTPPWFAWALSTALLIPLAWSIQDLTSQSESFCVFHGFMEWAVGIFCNTDLHAHERLKIMPILIRHYKKKMCKFSVKTSFSNKRTHDTRTDDEKNENWSAYYPAVYGEVSGNVKTTNLRMFHIVWLK